MEGNRASGASDTSHQRRRTVNQEFGSQTFWAMSFVTCVRDV
jgi:hypothetical protein